MSKVLVCGDRNWDDRHRMLLAIEHHVEPHETIIEGGCRGADLMARSICEQFNRPFIEVKAEWSKYGRAAGPIRNSRMLTLKPRLVLAFHDNLKESKGTKNMIKLAEQVGIQVIVFESFKKLKELGHVGEVDEDLLRAKVDYLKAKGRI